MFFEIGAPVFEVSMVALTTRVWDEAAQGRASTNRRQTTGRRESVFATANLRNECIILLLPILDGAKCQSPCDRRMPLKPIDCDDRPRLYIEPGSRLRLNRDDGHGSRSYCE